MLTLVAVPLPIFTVPIVPVYAPDAMLTVGVDVPVPLARLRVRAPAVAVPCVPPRRLTDAVPVAPEPVCPPLPWAMYTVVDAAVPICTSLDEELPMLRVVVEAAVPALPEPRLMVMVENPEPLPRLRI